jgi:hypothetical protein
MENTQNNNMIDLLSNLDKLHTTEMGVERIRRNLALTADDVVLWCRGQIEQTGDITRRGKNWYASVSNAVITINAYSYTIITAHKVKKVKEVI